MSYNPKLEDIVKFLLDGRIFKKWHVVQILATLIDSLESDTLLWYVKNDKLVGVAIGKRDDVNKIVHVIGLDVREKGNIKLFLKAFKKRFPGYVLTAMGVVRCWNIRILTSYAEYRF